MPLAIVGAMLWAPMARITISFVAHGAGGGLRLANLTCSSHQPMPVRGPTEVMDGDCCSSADATVATGSAPSDSARLALPDRLADPGWDRLVSLDAVHQLAEHPSELP